MKREIHGGTRLVSRAVAIGLGPILLAGPLAGAALAKPPVRPPAPVITANPTDPTNVTSAAFSYTDASTASTFKFLCQLDGVGKACNAHTTASPAGHAGSVSFSGLAAGNHSFRVRVRAGGKLSTWRAFSWTIDLTPPAAPSVALNGPTPTNQKSVSFTLSDTDPSATFLCSVDGGAAGACLSGFLTPELADGSHDIGVIAVDAAGNRSSATHAQWVVDTLAPAKPIIQTGPASTTNQTDADFIFSESDSDTTLKCSLDGGAFSNCDSRTAQHYAGPLSSLPANNPHTFQVEAVDAAGNVAMADTVWSWTIDTTPGVAIPPTFTAGPANPSNLTHPAFTFGSVEPAVHTFECSLDGAAFTACNSGDPVAVAGDGQHTFSARTVASGKTTSAATPYTWTLDATRPVATGIAPKSLLGPAGLVFSEAVTHVSRSTVHLRVADSATNLSLLPLTCRNGGVVVSCAGSVTAVAIRPVHALMPGQRYRLVVDSSITDLAGNVVKSQLTAFRAPRVVEENSVAVHDAWRVGKATGAYGHSFVTSHDAGSSATRVFKGSAITWYAVKGPNQGLAAVYVDGVRKGTVNNYAAETTYRVGHAIKGLAAGAHRLTVKVLGKKGSRAATGTWVSVDAVKVGTKLTATPTLTMLWTRVTAEGAYAKHYARSSAGGSSVRLTFRGTSIRWITVKGRSMGKAKVYIDGKYRGTFDQYAASIRYRVVRVWKGLTNTVHTIKVVPTGTHHAGAKGNSVALDRFLVG